MRTGNRRPGREPPAAGAALGSAVRLPYTVELWNMPRTGPERVLARAASLSIARTIFTAARSENLGRLIVLRKGAEILQRTE
jgi:hypothetical protein